MVEFTIYGELPDLNYIVNAAKKHWANYAKLKADYGDVVTYSALSQGVPIQDDRVLVSITWYCPNRLKDPDNVSFGIKFVLDGLVAAGVLENDGWKQIGGICHTFRIDKDRPRVQVQLQKFG